MSWPRTPAVVVGLLLLATSCATGTTPVRDAIESTRTGSESAANGPDDWHRPAANPELPLTPSDPDTSLVVARGEVDVGEGQTVEFVAPIVSRGYA